MRRIGPRRRRGRAGRGGGTSFDVAPGRTRFHRRLVGVSGPCHVCRGCSRDEHIRTRTCARHVEGSPHRLVPRAPEEPDCPRMAAAPARNSIRRNVVLPAPLGPRTPYTSPWATCKVIASTATRSPYAWSPRRRRRQGSRSCAGTVRPVHEPWVTRRRASRAGRHAASWLGGVRPCLPSGAARGRGRCARSPR